MSGSGAEAEDGRQDLIGLTLVIASQRSGSTLLCRDIKSLGNMGNPKEYFLDILKQRGKPGNRPREADVLRMIGRGAAEDNPQIGAVKLMVSYAPKIDAFIRNAKPVAPSRAIQNIIDWAYDRFEMVNLVALTREKSLDQAISRAVANMTDVWHRRAKVVGDGDPYKDVSLDTHKLNRAIIRALPAVLRSTEVINTIAKRNRETCLKLNYEELAASVESTSRKLVEHARRAGFAPEREVATRHTQKLIDDEMAKKIRLNFRRYLERRLELW